MYPINVVEKETGINKYLLRMWERRYTFPHPARDDKGERLYSDTDVEKLKLVKALMQEGYRPSKIINQSIDALKSLLKSFEPTKTETVVLITSPELEQEALHLLQSQNVKKILRVSTTKDLQDLAI